MGNRKLLIDGGPSQYELLIHGLDRRRGVNRTLQFKFKGDHSVCQAGQFALESVGIPDKDVIDPNRDTWMLVMKSRVENSRWRGLYSTGERTGWIEQIA